MTDDELICPLCVDECAECGAEVGEPCSSYCPRHAQNRPATPLKGDGPISETSPKEST